MAELLLANKAIVDAKANGERSPLYTAGKYNNKDLIEEMGGVPPSGPGVGWVTPLHYAATNNHKDVAELLLDHGADVNEKDNEGATPLHWAARDGCNESADLLLAHRADVNAKDNSGNTPLHTAEANKYKDVVELLRQHGGHE